MPEKRNIQARKQKTHFVKPSYITLLGKYKFSIRISWLALIVISKQRLFVYQWNVYHCWSDFRQGVEINSHSLLPSIPGILFNWSGASQSPGTCPWSSSWKGWEEAGLHVQLQGQTELAHQLGCRGRTWEHIRRKMDLWEIKTFPQPALSLVFLQSHWIYGEPALGREPPFLPEPHTYKLVSNWVRSFKK